MLIKEKITRKLNEQINIVKLIVVDESDKHKGHQGYSDIGETHFKITIVSDEFINKSKINRHKIIYNILREEMSGRIHALSINAKTPDEYKT